MCRMDNQPHTIDLRQVSRDDFCYSLADFSLLQAAKIPIPLRFIEEILIDDSHYGIVSKKYYELDQFIDAVLALGYHVRPLAKIYWSDKFELSGNSDN